MRSISRFALGLVVCWGTTAASAAPELCTPARYTRGDQFTGYLDLDPEPLRMRVAGLQAPFKGYPYGPEARERLKALIDGVVLCDCPVRDRHRRQPCVVRTRGGEDVAEIMLREGLGCVESSHGAITKGLNLRAYQAAQAEARTARRGLWSEPDAACPQDMRRRLSIR